MRRFVIAEQTVHASVVATFDVALKRGRVAFGNDKSDT
jgi:hypothetical protein